MTPLAGKQAWELIPEKEAMLMEGGEEMLDRAGEVVREELLGSASVEQEVATKIGDLLAQRRDIIGKMADLKIVAARTLLLDNESIEKLEHFRESNLEVFQVLEINEKLAGYEDDFKSILLLFADVATIRGVVYLLEKEGEVPDKLREALAELPERFRNSEHPRRQLLADLAAIAHSDKLSKTLLSITVRRMLRASRALPAPRTLLTEIAAELGVKAKDPWIDNGRITKRFPAFYKALMEKPSGEVQKAAEAVFTRMSDKKLPKLTWK